MKNLSTSIKLHPSNNMLDGRSCYIDNIRFILIFLVVCAHFMEYSGVFKTSFKFIYLFHMPAFIFISGYFTKPEQSAQKNLGLFSLYFICFTIFYFVGTFLLGKELKFTLLNPNSFIGLWYLLSLCIWNLIVPFFAQMKASIVIPLTFLIGLLIGLDNSIGTFLSLSRVFVFFPFYMLGYYAHRYKWLEKSKSFRWTPVLAIGIILFLVFIFWSHTISVSTFILTSKRSYATMKMTPIEGLIRRGRFYLASSAMCWAFFILIPQCKLFFTQFGKNTISVYFFHLILIYCLIEWEMLPAIAEKYSRFSILLIALAITFLFSLPIFVKPFNWILKAKFSWIRANNIQN